MKKINVMVVLSLILLATSCTTVKVQNSAKKVAPVNSIALFPTMIGSLKKINFSLGAAAFNPKVNGIAEQIIDMEKKSVDNYRTTISASLKQNFNCEIISGESLTSKPEFSELKNKYNYQQNLKVDDENFPEIILASNDFNPFQFNKGNVINYFKDTTNHKQYKQTISDICKKLKTDLIVVSYSELHASGINFGRGYLELYTYIYLFDKDGDLVSEGHNSTDVKPTISGREVEEFKAKIDKLSSLLDPLMVKIASNFKAN